jgi:hypothetical protein
VRGGGERALEQQTAVLSFGGMFWAFGMRYVNRHTGRLAVAFAFLFFFLGVSIGRCFPGKGKST